MGLFGRKAIQSATHQFYFSAYEGSPLAMSFRLDARKHYFSDKWDIVEVKEAPFTRGLHTDGRPYGRYPVYETVKASGVSLAEVFNAMAEFESTDMAFRLSTARDAECHIGNSPAYQDYIYNRLGMARDHVFHHNVDVPECDSSYWKNYRLKHGA